MGSRYHLTVLLGLVVLICFFVPLPAELFAQSKKQKDAAALQAAQQSVQAYAAQHVRDLATIDRLIKEQAAAALALKNSASNGAAIAKLATDNKQRAAAATLQGDAHTAAVQAALEPVQQAAADTKTTVQAAATQIIASTDQTRLELERTRLALATLAAAKPINSVALWTAAITGIVSIALALITRQKVVAQGAIIEQQGVELKKTGATVDVIHGLSNSGMVVAKEGIALGRRADATSRGLVYKLDPTKQNKADMEAAQKVASVAEKEFEEHKELQASLTAAIAHPAESPGPAPVLA